VEAESWRTLLSIGGFALVISAYLCFLAKVSWASVIQILVLSLVSGAAIIYVVLLSTRGLRLVDACLVTALSALWFFGLLLSTFASNGSRLLSLLALELLLVPLLRAWARSRWMLIDWIINRPTRMKQRAIGAAAR